MFLMMIEVASRAPNKSKELGYGDEEFLPWDPGVML